MPSPSSPESPGLEFDNLPNRITLFRICLVPLILACLFLQNTNWLLWGMDKSWLGWIAGWTFVLASVTDFVDGHIARKKNIVTIFGSFLDPIADKFLTVSALLMLQSMGRIHVLLVVILVLREIYMTSLRLLAANAGLSVPVSFAGKLKTAAIMTGIPMLMAFERPWGVPFPLLGDVFIGIAAILSLYSSGQYSLGLIRKIRMRRQKNAESKAHQG